MKRLYSVTIIDATTGNIASFKITDMKYVKASLKTKDEEHEYEIDYINRDKGTLEDLVKVAEYIKDRLGVGYENDSELVINTNIYTSSIEFNGDDITWECIIGAIRICEGEYKIKQGSQIVGKGYDLIKQYIKLN